MNYIFYKFSYFIFDQSMHHYYLWPPAIYMVTYLFRCSKSPRYNDP